MFMHTPWFYYELTYCNIRRLTDSPTEIEQKFNETLEKEQNCLVILPDSIRNYLSKFIDDDWMKKNNPAKNESGSMPKENPPEPVMTDPVMHTV